MNAQLVGGDLNSQPMQQTPDGMSFWFKWLIKGSAVILGGVGMLLGVITALSISLSCIIAGIILM